MRYRIERYALLAAPGSPRRVLFSETDNRREAETVSTLIGGRAIDTYTGEVFTKAMGFWMRPFLVLEGGMVNG